MKLRTILAAAFAFIPAAALAGSLTLLGAGGPPASGVTFSNSTGIAFMGDVSLGSASAALGVTNSKTLTTSFWTLGSLIAPGNNLTTLANSNVINSVPATNCEVSVGTAAGICVAYDNSSAHAQFNFNNSTGTTVGTDAIKTVGTGATAAQILPPGVWTHYLISLDAANNLLAVVQNGVNVTGGIFTTTTVANTSPDLNSSSGFHLVNNTTSIGFFGWFSDFFIDEESMVCSGAGTPSTMFGASVTCAAANTIPPEMITKFISSSKPVALGATCTNPTGRQPEVCLTGTSTQSVTNKGTATTALAVTSLVGSNGRLADAPYPPTGIPAHQATMIWQPQYRTVASGVTSMTTNAGTMPIATGDFLVIWGEVGDAGVTNHNLQCPTGVTSTWTQVGPGYDPSGGMSDVMCYTFASAGETGANALTYTGSTTRTAGWVMADYGQTVASVDTGATGCRIRSTGSPTGCAGNSTTNQTTILTPSLTTSSPNETVVSAFVNFNAGNKTFTAPASGAERFHAKQSGSQAQIEIGDQYAVASGSNTQNTVTMGASDSSVGFSLALVPN